MASVFDDLSRELLRQTFFLSRRVPDRAHRCLCAAPNWGWSQGRQQTATQLRRLLPSAGSPPETVLASIAHVAHWAILDPTVGVRKLILRQHTQERQRQSGDLRVLDQKTRLILRGRASRIPSHCVVTVATSTGQGCSVSVCYHLLRSSTTFDDASLNESTAEVLMTGQTRHQCDDC